MAKSTQAQAAAAIRKHLKANNVAAKVSSESASMMTAVRVRLIDPMPATRALVEDYNGQYQYGHFDGMTDGYEFSNNRDDIPQVTYVILSVDYSDELKAEARDYLAANIDTLVFDRECYWTESLVTSNLLSGRIDSSFWTSRKPRVKATA